MNDAQQIKRLLAGVWYPEIPGEVAEQIDAAIATEAAIRIAWPSHRFESVASQTAVMARHAAKARAEAEAMREETRRMSQLADDTQGAVVETIERLASMYPGNAEILDELHQAATLGAARAARHVVA